jgi:hypothetical protein
VSSGHLRRYPGEAWSADLRDRFSHLWDRPVYQPEPCEPAAVPDLASGWEPKAVAKGGRGK